MKCLEQSCIQSREAYFLTTRGTLIFHNPFFMDSRRRPKHLRGKEFSEVVGLADGGDGMDISHTAVAFAWNCSSRAEGAGLLHGHDGGGVTADDCSEGAFDALCLSDAC